MSREVTMPHLGFTMVEGTVSRWLKGEGERIAKGEPLMEVTSEKATVEVESPVAGVMERILVPTGDTVPVGARVCLVAAEEEAAIADIGSRGVDMGKSAPQSNPLVSQSPAARTPAATVPEGPRVRASGLAKRLAGERSIDLAGLRGSGPGGRVLESDVVAYLAAGTSRGPVYHEDTKATKGDFGTVGTGLVPFRSNDGDHDTSGTSPVPTPGEAESQAAKDKPFPYDLSLAARVPFTGTRRLTAERMFQSVQSTAQVTLVAEVDGTEAVRFREQLLPEWERTDGVRLSFNDLIVKACGKALGEHPYMNATLAGDEILLHSEVNVGIAVALEDGLVVPVIRNAGTRHLREIAVEARALADRARRKALSPDDMRGGTFTVTNLGGYGIDFFTPIINSPEAAILGVGRVAERPAVYNGEVCKRSLMYLSLTFDHRLVDGAPAARFLGRILEMLERPYLLLT